MGRKVLYLLLVFVSTLLLALEVPTVNYKYYKLSNGLQVYVFEDRTIPLVKFEIWYKVGSIDELEGRTGAAHLLEHVMFNGTEALKKGKLDELITSVGGENNAGTYYDYTVYYEVVPSAKLELAIAIEADRMRNLKIDPEDFYRELDVVKQERRQSTENNYIQSGWEELQAKAFEKTPLGHFIIGWMNDLSNMTHEYIRSFYEMFYAPNNAIIAISGDVNPDEAVKLVEKYFGDYKPMEIKRPEYRTTKFEGEKVIRLPRLTKLALMLQMYNIPRGDHPDIAAINALLDIWLNSESSRVNNELYYNKGLILGCGGFTNDLRIPSYALVYAFGYREADLDLIKQEMDKELEKIVKEGVSEEELTKVKKTLLKNIMFRLKDIKEFSEEVILGALRYDDPLFYKKQIENIAKLTSADIQRVAREYFLPKNRYVGYIVPNR
ncbi:MAG: insulinase family protein [Fervidobacterium sp.]|nr:insulinase family protein [Fervidobacterium sp.]